MNELRPNFIIVGAPKCGTTAWVDYLSAHPDVFFSQAKEPHYFCTDFANFRWAETEEAYLQLFEGAGQARIIGEASVMYLYSCEAAHRIHAFNDRTKILILLREQGSFLPSYHNQTLYNRDETILDFAEAWRISEQGSERSIPRSCREPAFLDYVAVGDFETQVERYLDVFPAHQIRVVWMESWRDDPGRLYHSLLDFLGLEQHSLDHFKVTNTGHRHRSRLVASLTNNPPKWALRVAKIVKRAIGVDRMNIADRLRRMNRADGYTTAPKSALQAQINDKYGESNARLRTRIASLGVGFN